MRTALLAALVALLAGAPAHAAFEDLGAGARAPGMGDAFTSLADDVYALHYNPAGLAQVERPQFSASYTKLFTGLSDGSDLGLSQLAYAQPFKFGSEGTLAVGWDRFALNNLYTNETLQLAYGRPLYSWESGRKLYAGVTLKYLTQSFGTVPEAFASCNGVSCSSANGADPVLSGKTSKSAPDADIGFLYRLPRRFQMGLLIQHAMQPNVGFADADKLQRNYHAGVSYKSLWMNLVGELQLNKAPGGGTDKDFIMGGERYFPSLDYGQFGLRGSLGFGSREWKQITLGGSYRINKIQFDYAYLMPIGEFSAAGTHRFALTFHFGAPAPDEALTQELLEKAREVNESKTSVAAAAAAAAQGRQPYAYEFEDNLRPHSLDDPHLAELRALILEGRFRQARVRLDEITKDQPHDPTMDKLASRLDIASYYYPELLRPTDRWEVALSTSIASFLFGQDHRAILHGSYALSLSPGDDRIEHYLEKVEKATALKADRLSPDSTRGYVAELLYRVEAANNRGDTARAVEILKDVLDLEPQQVTALERLGSAYYLMHRYPEALDAWQRAAPLESKPAELRSLREYMGQAEKQTGQLVALPGGVAAPAPQPLPQPPQQQPSARPQASLPTATSASGSAGDPRDIADLYQKGVEYYARGEYLQATAMFMRILQIDPQNAQARKAMERIQRLQAK